MHDIRFIERDELRDDKDSLTLHRYGWRVASDEAQYVVSCYHGRRCLQVRGSLQRDIQGRRLGRLETRC
jgi:hypothetical protein